MTTFTKIKWDGSSMLLKWTTQRGKEAYEHQLTADDAPRPEFITALGALVPDVCEVCELQEAYAKDLRVQSISLSESAAGDRGAVITALKKVSIAGAPLVLNTPHLVEDGERNTMPSRMARHVQTLEEEAERYLNGERAQKDLFASDGAPHTDALTALDRQMEDASTTMSIDGGPPVPFDAEKLGRHLHKKLRGPKS